MDLIFCTLFDSNYIDKGLVLYHSMIEHISCFKLYVLAFDKLCEKILKEENLDKLVVVSMDDFETEDLLKVKKQRTKAEYCWTCSPWIIKYVLEKYGEDSCTYIDADMMFFSTPEPVIRDMINNKKSILIVPHRFETKEEEQKVHNEVGSYCVEFNTFFNDVNGRKALNWWAEKCIEWCYYSIPGTTEWYGDQKYLNVFPIKFDGVRICEHIGVGLAPWNSKLVEEVESNNNKVILRDKNNKKEYPLIIYHFENVGFVSKHILHASSGKLSKKLHSKIYDVYIDRIIKQRMEIEKKYKFKISRSRRVITKNIILKIYHKYITPIKRIKKISDLYWVK